MTLQKMKDYASEFPRYSVEESILGLHEAATKLYQASKRGGEEETAKRLANIVIGVAFAANALGIDNLDEALEKRMIEFQNEDK